MITLKKIRTTEHKFAFNYDNKYSPQVFLDSYLYKLAG